VEAAGDQFEHAWSLACQLGDPCWEHGCPRPRPAERHPGRPPYRLGLVGRGRRPVATLASLAARGDLRELVVRAQLHRSRLGDPAALASARLLAAGIDNPALTPLLDGVPAGPELQPASWP
jgi:hypothetical protein